MALMLALAASLTGCNLKSHAIPAAPLPFASVDYTVMGATSAEACGTYIFAVDFGHLFADQQGSTSAGGGDALSALLGVVTGGGNAESGRALYDALQKMPEATNLYAPKIHTTVTGLAPFGYPVFGRRCVTVEAHGVKVGTGPVPGAN